MLALGLAMNAVFMPINKNLWTPSYTVFMTGWSLVLLAIFHALLDDSPPAIRRRTRAACLPLTILGMNALFIFAFSGLVARLLVSIHVDDLSLKALLYDPIRALPLAPEDASLFYAIAFELAMFVVAWFMWKKRWFVKA